MELPKGAQLVSVFHEALTGCKDGTKTLHLIQYIFETNTSSKRFVRNGRAEQDAKSFRRRLRNEQVREAD